MKKFIRVMLLPLIICLIVVVLVGLTPITHQPRLIEAPVNYETIKPQ